MPLWEFVGYRDNDTRHPRFGVNLISEKFKKLVSGHVFAHTAPVLSRTVQSDMAVEALFSLYPAWNEQGMIPTMLKANIPTPICVDSSREVWIDYEAPDTEHTLWQLNISSTSAEGTLPRRHLHGRLHIRSPSDPDFIAQFARFERLVPYEQCARLLAEAGGPDVDVLQGRQVYRAFSEFIEYSDQYNAMHAVVGRKNECAGRVHRQNSGDSFLDIALHDSFKQVSGLLNCMSNAEPSEIHIGSDVELVMRSPRGILEPGCTQDVWHVYARHSQVSAKVYMADAFVFNAANGELVEVILGLQYTRMSIESMKRLLMNLTRDEWALNMNTGGATVTNHAPKVPQSDVESSSKKPQEKQKDTKKASLQSLKSDLATDVTRMLASVVGVEPNTITLNSDSADIGIDSLMGIELLRELNSAFHCKVDLAQLLEAPTVGHIVTLVAGALSQGTGQLMDDEHYDDDNDASESSGDSRPISTSASGLETATSEDDPSPIQDIQTEETKRDVTEREVEAERYVAEYTAGWTPTQPSHTTEAIPGSHDAVVIVTGATGSLGAHIVADLVSRPSVKTVVCINRHRPMPVETRQDGAFSSRGIKLTPEAWSKLRIFATDSSQPQLGLGTFDYQWLTQNGSHIVHSAWPLSGSRPMFAFESQFQTMRNLLDLARDIAVHRRVGFQLISSLSVVGHSREPLVLEKQVHMTSVLPGGYGEAKWVCERMLDETLHRYPALFRAMAVRPAQIAGSSTSGVWNSVEQIPFIVKSAQSLGAWPDFHGTVRWIPVDAVAATLVDLLYIGDDKIAPNPARIYHIDDPVGRPWEEISSVLAEALEIPAGRFMPFKDWLGRVAHSSRPEMENPAKRLVDFVEQNFERLSCGQLVLDTTKAQEHSAAMRPLKPVSAEVARGYIRAWKEMGFLAW